MLVDRTSRILYLMLLHLISSSRRCPRLWKMTQPRMSRSNASRSQSKEMTISTSEFPRPASYRSPQRNRRLVRSRGPSRSRTITSLNFMKRSSRVRISIKHTRMRSMTHIRTKTLKILRSCPSRCSLLRMLLSDLRRRQIPSWPGESSWKRNRWMKGSCSWTIRHLRVK